MAIIMPSFLTKRSYMSELWFYSAPEGSLVIWSVPLIILVCLLALPWSKSSSQHPRLWREPPTFPSTIHIFGHLVLMAWDSPGLISSAISRFKDIPARLRLVIIDIANINTYKLAFWMIAYIVFDLELLAALHAETSLAYQDGNINVSYLMENCPRLDAVFLETLRVANGALSARKIVSPTQIRSKVLRSGNTILMPLRQLHYDEVAFGENTARFDPERFLKEKSLRSSSSFRPFGGGISYCPGRFLAKQEMLFFVALIINRFDIELADEDLQDEEISRPQKFPKLDESTPALGVNGPAKGSDVYVNFRKRDH